jgi:hypothetical protein
LTTPKRASIARLLLLAALYGAAVCWLTWPLASDPESTLPCTNAACTFDTRFSAWTLAWQSHALVTQPARFGDANIYFPAPDALYYGPTGFGALPYFAPIFLASGQAALATNVMLLLSVTLSALALHEVVRRWTGFDSAGVLAAATLLVQRWYLWGFIATTPHLAPIQYFPLIVWLAATPVLGLGQALLLVTLIVAQCLTDLVYVAAAVMAPLALLALARVVRPRSRRSGFRLLLVLAAALLCLAPSALGYLRVRAHNPLLAEQSQWPSNLLPSQVQASLWTDLRSLFWSQSAPTTIAPAAIVLIVLGGALAAFRRRRASCAHDAGWCHGLLWLLVGTWISLPPVALWGARQVALPQLLLAKLTPLYAIIRVPERLGVAALIGACILCGIAFAEIARALEHDLPARIPARAFRATLALLVVLALYEIPPGGTAPIPKIFPVQHMPTVPEPFAADLTRAHGPLLQLPALYKRADRGPDPNWNAYAMYLSTFHWRPLLNGYSSYWPAGFDERMRVAEQLPAPAALARLVHETGLSMVWVDLIGYLPEQRARWREAVLGHVPGLELRAHEKGQLLFAVDATALAVHRSR